VASGRFAGKNNPRWLGGVSNDNMRYRRRQLEREPVKEAARRATMYAIRVGKLVRQPCEQCGAEPGHAHHDDYSKPLDVRWLCRPCHTEHHVNERKRAG
jgi:ribosomal protein S27AE